MTLLLVALTGLTGLLVCLTAGDRTRLGVAALLAVPQVFAGPLGQLSLPLSQCWTVLIAVCWVVEGKGLPLRDPVLRAVLALTAAQGVAIAWSPDPLAGVLECTRLLSFAFLHLHVVRVEREDPRGAGAALKLVLAWAVLAAALVWLFRLSPAAETAYLRSPLAGLVAGQNAVRAFWGEGANNVMDPAKAGGFFLNANVASMFLGVATFAFLVLRVREGRRRWLLGALLTWSATFATGSKTAAALALLLPVAVRAVHVLGRPAARWFLPQAALAVGAGAWLLPRLLERYVPGYADASEESLASRAPLWDAALEMVHQHLLLGVGHGGWTAALEQYAALGVDALPPHNLLIAAWAASGLAGLLGVLAVAGAVLHRLVVAVVRGGGSPAARTAGFALGAWLWALVHGMGDNTAVYGEAKSMLLLAALLGLVTAGNAAAGRSAGTGAGAAGAPVPRPGGRPGG
ncbi:O-antigen ligase family protein, partial [Kineococcus indalonis]|uniref:O-antigen ligase family protein n=1 Tax=Kineococcus indalonis TaxID=2696566 RepID=UPI0014137699